MSARDLKNLTPHSSDLALQRILYASPGSQGRSSRRRNIEARSPGASSLLRTPSTAQNPSAPTRERFDTRPIVIIERSSPGPKPERQSIIQTSANMSSQRRGVARSGQRGGSGEDHFNINELWDDVKKSLAGISDIEKEAKALKEKIIALEGRMKLKKDNGSGIPISEYTELEALYREQVKVGELQRTSAADPGLVTKIQLLADMQRQNEQNEDSLPSARNSSSRTSGIDFDGPSDSPVPSPADNRVRKLGGSRTSSQPPRSNTERLEGTPSEASERAGKPKVVYILGEEVAFKRKIPGGKPEEQDWIQGEVVRVIGDGKSRRYDVKDIDPDAANSPNIYKSSASQMVPIPPEGTTFGEYEVGKHVLALYPQATTFYRAEVKSTIDGGARVLLIFEEENVEKPVARRFVLDHKG